MIDEDWGGFASAFTETVRPEGARGPYGKRMFMVGFAAVSAMLLGAVAYGASHPKPSSKPSATSATAKSGSSKSASPGASRAADWTVVAGPTCSAASTSFAATGYSTAAFSALLSGWSTADHGGYNGEGCTGGFLSMPLSGQATNYDATRFALWKFTLAASLTSASCRLSAYVPDGNSIVSVGGDPARYYYYGGDYSAGSTASALGGFQVDQVSNRGRWVTGPAFRADTGKVTVRLFDAGLNQTSATENAHVAVAQVRLTCQAG